ncbi:MAG: hypothetical protein ACE5HT_15315 [Gemmatimonadales bacterium]
MSLPTELAIRGAGIARDSSLVFWGKSFVMFADRNTRARVCPSEISNPVSAAFVESGGRLHIEVITADGRLVIDTLPRAYVPCEVVAHLTSVDSVVAATHVDQRWFLIGVRKRDGRSLFSIASDNTPRKLAGASRWLGEDTADVHLTSGSEGDAQ